MAAIEPPAENQTVSLCRSVGEKIMRFEKGCNPIAAGAIGWGFGPGSKVAGFIPPKP